MTDQEKLEQWEKAYRSLYKFGHIGRVFKGTVHNLNGVVQAFSMQTELFELMFSKFRKQLTPLYEENLSSSANKALDTVLNLIEKREKMLAPMTEKVAYSQEIIKNTENICHRSLGVESLSLQILLQNIINFYQSDMYFKHKVTVVTDINSEVIVDKICSELGLIFQNLIQNAIMSLVLNDSNNPEIYFKCIESDTHVQIHIQDNGEGIDPTIQDSMFEPFVSGWSDQSGLGLYFCKQIANMIGCTVHYESVEGLTDFIVTIPK